MDLGYFSISLAVKDLVASKQDPDHYEVGSTGWVTARFTIEKPMPKARWEKWLDESYALSRAVRAARRQQK